MNNTDINKLGPIQKTLFLPVWSRAIETLKSKPIIIDKTAKEIIECSDFDFTQMTKNLKEINQIAWIARCKRFDLVIKNFINNNPTGIVVNIGCGLDTTYERINNHQIIWYDLDLPDVIELRRKFIKETPNRKFIASSFLNTNWFNDIPRKNNVLFISMGVFIYFDESEIKDFIKQIAENFTNSEMLFDVTSPKGLEIANQVIINSGFDKSSFFKWGLTDKSLIASWDKRITIKKTYYTFKIKGLRLNLKNRITGFISDLLGVMYMIHLKIS